MFYIPFLPDCVASLEEIGLEDYFALLHSAVTVGYLGVRNTHCLGGVQKFEQPLLVLMLAHLSNICA